MRNRTIQKKGPLLGLLLLLVTMLAFPLTANADLRAYRFDLDGYDRDYLFYVPTGLSGPAPLVVVLHGGGGNARQILRGTGQRFNELADEQGFYVLYPNAVDGVWDFGEGVISESLNTRRDDLAYLTTVIAAVSTSVSVDSERIFATGISRGGQASYFLACKKPDLIRAIAPVAMPLPEFLLDDCNSVSDKGILVMNGTADPIVPYTGGQIRIGRQDRGAVLPTTATMALFADRNGCGSALTSRTVGAVTVTEHTNCRAPTVLYRIEGGGHTWPSGRSFLPRLLVGPTNWDINAADEIWAFFSRF